MFWILFLGQLATATTPESHARLYIVPSRVEAVAPHTGSYTGLTDRFVHAVDWASRHGWHATASGVAVLYDDPTAVPTRRLHSEARVPLNIYGRLLPQPEPGEEGIHLEKSPAVLVLAAIHTGTYDTIASTYAQLYRELPGRRLTATGPTRELYLDDPAFTPEDELRTEVQIVVEPMGRADIAIYADDGGYASGITAASLAFNSAGFSITTVTASDINEGRLRSQARALYMPGGWAEHYVMDIDDAGATEIMNFMERGGGYIGVCAGSFYAAETIIWGNTEYPYDLDLFPGVPTGPVIEIASWPYYVTTTITLDSTHPISAENPQQRTVLYYGGPIFVPNIGAEVSVIARFDENNEPAIVAFEHGRGRSFLTSVHLEYDLTSDRDGTTWPELERHINDPESDWPLLIEAARWVLKENE